MTVLAAEHYRLWEHDGCVSRLMHAQHEKPSAVISEIHSKHLYSRDMLAIACMYVPRGAHRVTACLG